MGQHPTALHEAAGCFAFLAGTPVKLTKRCFRNHSAASAGHADREVAGCQCSVRCFLPVHFWWAWVSPVSSAWKPVMPEVSTSKLTRFLESFSRRLNLRRDRGRSAVATVRFGRRFPSETEKNDGCTSEQRDRAHDGGRQVQTRLFLDVDPPGSRCCRSGSWVQGAWG